MFKNIKDDLRTYDGNWRCQGFWVMVVYRYGRWCYLIRFKYCRKLFLFIYKILFKFVQICTGIELPCQTKIGKNFHIHHFGGIIISGNAEIGDNCHIRNGVTIGAQRVNEVWAPKIGDNVDIGAGAKILGKIIIGNNVSIGANSVIIKDVADNSIAVGIPARIISKSPSINMMKKDLSDNN